MCRLGQTGLQVSRLAFGAGPVPALMTGTEGGQRRAVVRRALDAGINWFDTAAGYGDGQSELNLGTTLSELGARDAVHLATKVRLVGDDFLAPERAIRESLARSLQRLGVERVTLLQLHNAVTVGRGDLAASVSVDDVLRQGGVADVFARLRDEGRIGWCGLTGTGDAESLRSVVASGRFHTIQAPYNLVNPSAGQPLDEDFRETNYRQLFAVCQQYDVGVLAIRVLAGGALAGQPPSPHTYRTPYFPLDLYHRDQERAAVLAEFWRHRGLSLKEAAVRFVLAHPAVTAAIIGFSAPEQVDELCEYADRGPLPA